MELKHLQKFNPLIKLNQTKINSIPENIRIKEFFNKANKESLGSHANKFATVIASVDSLTAEVQTSFQETGSIKYEAFFNILKDLQKSLHNVHNALNTGSASTIICAFKNHLSKSYIKNLKIKLENTKKYLTENELKLVNNILTTSENILKGIPGDVSCAAIITKKSPNM